MTSRQRFQSALQVVLIALGMFGLFTFFAVKSLIRCHGVLAKAGVARGSVWWLEAGSFLALWPVLVLGYLFFHRRFRQTVRRGQVPILRSKPMTSRYILSLALMAPLVAALKAAVGKSGILILLPLTGVLEAVGLAMLWGGAWMLYDAVRRSKSPEHAQTTSIQAEA